MWTKCLLRPIAPSLFVLLTDENLEQVAKEINCATDKRVVFSDGGGTETILAIILERHTEWDRIAYAGEVLVWSGRRTFEIYSPIAFSQKFMEA